MPINGSLENSILRPLLRLDGVEEVHFRKDPDFLRIWVIINRPDDGVENTIYTEYLKALDHAGECETDLCVLFRMDREIGLIAPQGAQAATAV